ncbi:MAG: type IV secretion system DNA-binding domain-containing protein [Planctomycetota bacterium]|nr:type IV secretion system DNA-binding domain-containing protein [Planctomycetota bacterium]
MSLERAMLARAGPWMLAEKARAALREEVSKGCRPELSVEPVALEPVYQAVLGAKDSVICPRSDLWQIETPRLPERLARMRVWVSPQQQFDWKRSELLLKQLSCVAHRIGWEIIGNKDQIEVRLLCHEADLPVVHTAFLGQFEKCALSMIRADVLQEVSLRTWRDAVFRDFYPCPPYSHLLTRPEEIQRSPYSTLMTALASVPPPAVGFYQVVFSPTAPDHDWHQNVQALLDLEYAIKLLGGIANPVRYPQPGPSGDLKQMAMEVETKAHNDKPFYAVALRIGIIDAGEAAFQRLRSLATVASLFQQGGRPLNSLDHTNYLPFIDEMRLKRMFVEGLVYRPGFLLNSWELASLVHLPPPDLIEQLKPSFLGLETLPAEPSVSIGTPVGTSSYAGLDQNVCIPDDMRAKHVHLIGRPGQGKSSVVEFMVLHDIRQGHGVAVLDPHGRLVLRLLHLIPAEHADRVIYIDPSDSKWVPVWNPLNCHEGINRSRIADDLVRAFKGFVSGWGDRLEHLLRHAFFALLHLPHTSLLDVSNLLRQKSEESKRLRVQLLRVLENEVARQFWREDFDRYSSADLFPPQHKLSKLLAGETAALMLSQSDSSFSLRDVMDSGRILLVNLANMGSEVLEILGCFMLSLLHITALGRGMSPAESHRPFHIYCDEAHRFLTDAVEDLIAETRKFNVSLTLAHQFMSQFNTRQGDALSSVGSTIIFNVDTKDARHLVKDLQDKVELSDLITLDVGQAIARIGNHVVRVKTHHPLNVPQKHCADLIIRQSHERYYRPAAEVQKAVRNRSVRWVQSIPDSLGGRESFDGNNASGLGGEEGFEYDEL